jgi:TetR/AcrR family transcriptional regulator, cholesterol catabolism regulator
MPKGIRLNEAELDRRRHQIFRAAVKLFLKDGFHETSLREIGDEAGIGKSTIYDYFETKDEILIWGMEDELLDLTRAAEQIAAQPLPAVDRLRQVMQHHVEVLAASREFYVRLSFEVQRLGIQAQKRIQLRRHAYQDLIRALIDEGMQEGAFRKVDSLTVARVLIVSITPTIFTSRPTGTPQEMSDTALDVILRGIQA